MNIYGYFIKLKNIFFRFFYRNPQMSAGIQIPAENGERGPATGMGTRTGGKILNGDGSGGHVPAPMGTHCHL